MNKYDVLENSLLKNMQEFSEFVVDDLHINNYYDLVDLIVELNNFRAIMYKQNKELTLSVMKQIKESE